MGDSGICLPQMLAEPAWEPSKLFCPLHDVFAANIIGMFHNELLNFVLKFDNFSQGQRDLALSLPWPHQGSIEGFRGQVCREKGYRCKPEHFCCRHRGAKMTMIGFLHRGAACDPHLWFLLKIAATPCVITSKRSMDAPDTVMDLTGTVDRYDHVIEEGRDIIRAFEQQQTGG